MRIAPEHDALVAWAAHLLNVPMEDVRVSEPYVSERLRTPAMVWAKRRRSLGRGATVADACDDLARMVTLCERARILP